MSLFGIALSSAKRVLLVALTLSSAATYQLTPLLTSRNIDRPKSQTGSDHDLEVVEKQLLIDLHWLPHILQREGNQTP